MCLVGLSECLNGLRLFVPGAQNSHDDFYTAHDTSDTPDWPLYRVRASMTRSRIAADGSAGSLLDSSL